MHFDFKKITATVLCAVSVCVIAASAPAGSPVSVTAEAKTISQYQSELNSAKSKSNQLKNELNKLKKANAPYEEQKAALEKSIQATQHEIDLYADQIAACEKTINERSKQLAEQKDQFNKRLVAMYTNDSSNLSVLLSADDYGDYLAKAELVDSVSRKDYELITGIAAAVNDLKEANATLLTAKVEFDAKKTELTKQYAEVNAIVSKYQKDMQEVNNKLSQLEREEAEISAAIRKAQQAQQQQSYSNGGKGDSNKNVIYGTGSFAWPLPGYYTISSKFGARWGRQHSGIDVASSNGTVYGARIVAADSGTVILSKYYSGYGNCVMIDHGNGYVTLYGHMKAPSPLKVGDRVTKGSTTVGYVGASGNVTGPHLHFEIRKNGTAVNPLNYYN